jgi:hypothetical protein
LSPTRALLNAMQATRSSFSSSSFSNDCRMPFRSFGVRGAGGEEAGPEPFCRSNSAQCSGGAGSTVASCSGPAARSRPAGWEADAGAR